MNESFKKAKELGKIARRHNKPIYDTPIGFTKTECAFWKNGWEEEDEMR